MVMIEVGMFAHVKCSRYVDYGLQKGDTVYIAGDMMVRTDEKDPYAYRKLFVAARCNAGGVDVNGKGLSIDAANLKPVSKSQQKKLYTAFEKANQKES
tara:strand:- start:775 stop:1068 length:294 start_codon:yes stop_codon:yes gene_type:complete